MFTLARPDDRRVAAYLEQQAALGLRYAEPGATRRIAASSSESAPAGHRIDRYATPLGVGSETFERAKRALLSWQMFDIPWLELRAPPAIEAGAAVAVLVHVGGLWWLNACSIVYCEQETPRQCAFAYGTLPDHAESGEERFSVRWSEQDDQVRYEITAYSRPRHLLARLGSPVARQLQRRFGLASLAAMRRTCRG
jgi:uncharacterized protein (UPF0548 family)